MDGAIIQDTINSINELIVGSKQDVFGSNSLWMWIAIFELLIILYLVLFKKKEKQNSINQFKKEAMKESIDFGNIITSSFHVKTLYDELKVKCHPDRFPNDDEKNRIALELFQDISKNKTNFKKLLEIKELAQNKLGVKF